MIFLLIFLLQNLNMKH